jgi:dTDP-4-dehydrorhamnose 3,5-epimerase
MERIEHKTFKDNRGSYTPISTTELDLKWTQCSISVNDKEFTFRGLHYQSNPPQTKYIKVVQGSIVDFAVDLQTGETEFIELHDSDSVLIPNNKAHGFLTLEPNTIVVYLVEGEYNPESEHSIVWTTNPEVKKIVKYFVNEHPITISEKDAVGK